MKISAALAASVLFVGSVGACGDDGKAGAVAGPVPDVLSELVKDAKGSLQKALDKTASVKSVSFSMTGTMAGESLDFEGSMQLGDSARMEMSGKGPDGEPILARIIDSAIYIKMDPKELDGKTWLKMDLGAAGAGQDFSQQIEDADPVKQVQRMLAGDDVKVVGEETVDGVKAVHYTTTAPVEKYLETADAEQRDQLAKAMKDQGINEITTDIWVDEQYRPVQVKMEMGTAGTITVKYKDYDKPVTIEAPPAAETADFAEMMAELENLTQQ